MAPPLHKAIQKPDGFSLQIDKYIADCIASKKLPTIVGAALYLGCNKDQLAVWSDKYGPGAVESARLHDPNQTIPSAIKRLKQCSEDILVNKLFESSSNQNAMFLLKCMHKYVEHANVIKHDVSVKGTLSLNVIAPTGMSLGSQGAAKE